MLYQLKNINCRDKSAFFSQLIECLAPPSCERSLNPTFGLDKQVLNQFYNLLNGRELTVIVESEYIDGNYLDDYAFYYSKCFEPYGRYCKRVHFFLSEYTQEEFDELFFSDEGFTELGACYAGYVVARPIPEAFIGKTCLNIRLLLPESLSVFPTLQTIEVNLWGRKLDFMSLPFQEQDGVVSACATCSLWSSFHATGKLFHHRILSPYYITKNATATNPLHTRNFPNKGLTLTHLAHAIKSVGIDFFQAPCSELPIEKYLGKISGYMCLGIPVLLFGKVINSNGNDIGFHVVSVVGVKYLPEGESGITLEKDLGNFNLAQRYVESLFVHDDQLGPFTEYKLKRGKKTRFFSPSRATSLEFHCPNGQMFVVQHLVFPIYHKIRISYSQIFDFVCKMNDEIYSLKLLKGSKSFSFSWDINLTNSSNYKSNVLEREDLSIEQKRAVLIKNLPKYLWVANGSNVYHDDDEFEVVFDATGIHHDTNVCFVLPTPTALSIKDIYYADDALLFNNLPHKVQTVITKIL
ncbi:hypothetical protein [Pseudoalteromonas byunsanensis]|uniref:Uncharacterized protein n=1 Tax=Pseudoalteromonas byunsanensis TaxID=327939 RepID=A0A1S1N6Q4_9GAMM|nr:hypothetical protein [Pseudoalteromonas byunsanensis]OHU93941.1 hypothetical protein BIW53_17100 [Pseudoalteromonas byunsanensis]